MRRRRETLIRAFSHCERHQGQGGSSGQGHREPPQCCPSPGAPPCPGLWGDVSAQFWGEFILIILYLHIPQAAALIRGLSVQVTHRSRGLLMSVCFSLLAHRQPSWEARSGSECMGTEDSLPANRLTWHRRLGFEERMGYVIEGLPSSLSQVRGMWHTARLWAWLSSGSWGGDSVLTPALPQYNAARVG